MDKDSLIALIQDQGANFYDTEIANENGQKIYRVFITHKDGVSLDLCATISNIISPLLDVNPPMKGRYFLEVSSPGLERKLKKVEHFIGSVGENIELSFINSDKIIGLLQSADTNGIVLVENGNSLKISYDEIQNAKTYVQW